MFQDASRRALVAIDEHADLYFPRLQRLDDRLWEVIACIDDKCQLRWMVAGKESCSQCCLRMVSLHILRLNTSHHTNHKLLSHQRRLCKLADWDDEFRQAILLPATQN